MEIDRLIAGLGSESAARRRAVRILSRLGNSPGPWRTRVAQSAPGLALLVRRVGIDARVDRYPAPWVASLAGLREPGVGRPVLVVAAALATAFWMPGGSFLGLWPLLFGLLGVLPVWRTLKPPWRQHLWLTLTAMPTLLLLAPLMNEAYVALGPPAIFLPMLFLVLVLGALALQLEAVSRAWKWALPLAGVLIAAAAGLSPSV